MKNRTKSAFREWKANTEYLIECLSEEMGCALVNNDTNVLRALVFNIRILDKTKDIVSDWMEKGEGICGAAIATDGPMKDA